MEGLLARGAFNAEAARAAASVLVAYAAGLPAFVVLCTVTPLSFDTIRERLSL
jgi:peptidoglycan biosynthesis protein MviN/MurJ (putative lipid II flippase)